MDSRRKVALRSIIALILVATIPGETAAWDHGRRVHALLVVDTNSRLDGLDADERNINSCLATQLPSGSVSIRVLKGNDVSANAIDREIGAIAGRMDPKSDTFLFYYGGHGATINGEHSLTLNTQETISRGNLRRKLLGLNARLVVILTDCCANSVIVSLPKTVPAPSMPPKGTAPPVRILEQLFLEHMGLVDINSSSFDETSWGTNEGGVFTKSFARLAFGNDLAALDRRPRDGFVAWDEFFPAVRGVTIQEYQLLRINLLQDREVAAEDRNKLRGQVDQRPYAFSLAGRDRGARVPEKFARNLGIHYELVPLLGVRLTRDAPAGSVAAQRPLERGDMIVLLDNMPIFGINDVRNHVARTPVVFVNVRGGLAESFTFHLPTQLLPWQRDDFAPNFGVPIESVPLLGARLTRDAPPDSAAAQRPLERGDMIVLLDGTPIRGPNDVLAHQGVTPVVFINIRTGLAETFVFQLPNP